MELCIDVYIKENGCLRITNVNFTEDDLKEWLENYIKYNWGNAQLDSFSVDLIRT